MKFLLVFAFVSNLAFAEPFMIRMGERLGPGVFRYVSPQAFHGSADISASLSEKYKAGSKVWIISSDATFETSVESVKSLKEGDFSISEVSVKLPKVSAIKWSEPLILSNSDIPKQKIQWKPVSKDDQQFAKSWIVEHARREFAKLPPKEINLVRAGKPTEEWSCTWYHPNKKSIPPKENLKILKIAAQSKLYLLVTGPNCERGEYIVNKTELFEQYQTSKWTFIAENDDVTPFRDLNGDGFPEFTGCIGVGGTCQPYLFQFLPEKKLLTSGYFQ